MNGRALTIVALVLVFGPGRAEVALGALPQRPFPQHVAYAAGTTVPTGRTQAQQDQDVRDYYDLWKASFLVAAGTAADGTPLFRVSVGSTNPARTVSEGQGYGMLIVALMAGHDAGAQMLFDGLWKFSRLHPSHVDSRLMSFEVPEKPDVVNSAFDGDCDIAYALLLADRQWGSGGPIDYGQAAATVMAGIKESTIGPDSRLPMLGDWTDPDGATYNQYTPRSSDFMPDHFRAFFRATGDPVWPNVVAASQAVITSLQANDSPLTGLLPDFVVPVSDFDHTPQPAPPFFLEGPNDGAYYYNAVRDPWRLGTDALLSGDATSLAQTRALSSWAQGAAGGNPLAFNSGYTLSGAPLSPQFFSVIYVAPLGVAAMTEPAQQPWLNDVYETVRALHEDYYEDSVTLLCLLVMTGNYWAVGGDPKADLFVTKTDGLETAAPGQVLVYTITAGNAGPDNASGAVVSDSLPAGLQGATWTCAASGGAACGAASGAGNISETVSLPVGGQVIYTLTATVTLTPSSVRNTATVAVPAGFGEPDDRDNSATDADLLICDPATIAVVPDGRSTSGSLGMGQSVWYVASLAPASSYSVELVRTPGNGSAPVLTVYRGDDGCSGIATADARDTRAIEPGAGSAARVSFTAKGTDTRYRFRLDNGTGSALSYALQTSETTLWSAAWSTNSTYDTYYSLQNTTTAAVSGTLTFRDTAGFPAGEVALTIPAGRTLATNTAALAVLRNRTGTARLSHDGPPGAVLAEGDIANLAFSRPYVQPVKFIAVRER